VNKEMNTMDEFGKRLGLTSEQIQRIKTYREKAEESEVKYCEDHAREYYDFEFEGMCPICYEDKLWWRLEQGDNEAYEILKRSGRLGLEEEENRDGEGIPGKSGSGGG
jgi:hypothetical protein